MARANHTVLGNVAATASFGVSLFVTLLLVMYLASNQLFSAESGYVHGAMLIATFVAAGAGLLSCVCFAIGSFVHTVRVVPAHAAVLGVGAGVASLGAYLLSFFVGGYGTALAVLALPLLSFVAPVLARSRGR